MINEKRLSEIAKLFIDRYIDKEIIIARRVGWCYMSMELMRDLIILEQWQMIWKNKVIIVAQPELNMHETIQFVFYDNSLREISEDENPPMYTFKISKGIKTIEHPYKTYETETFFTCDWKEGKS